MIRNFLNVSQLWTSKVLHDARAHQRFSPPDVQSLRAGVFFSVHGKTVVSKRDDGARVIDSFGRRSSCSHLASSAICMYFVTTWCSAPSSFILHGHKTRVLDSSPIIWNYVEASVCRACLSLITHLFCITCVACSLPSPANRSDKRTKSNKKSSTISKFKRANMKLCLFLRTAAQDLYSLWSHCKMRVH